MKKDTDPNPFTSVYDARTEARYAKEIMALHRGLILLIGVVLFLVIGGMAFVTTMRLAVVPSPLPQLSPPSSSQRITQPSAAPVSSQPHVVCEGCNQKPIVEVRSTPAASSGEVTTSFRYTPEPYTVLGGTAKYPHDIVREILERHHLGHISFRVSIPNAAYVIEGTEIRPGVYEVSPSDVRLAESAVVSIHFSIKYPVLTDAQFSFLRSKKDYRFVYGLIRGIVDHELRHHRVLTNYAVSVDGILSSPVSSSFTVSAADRASFHARAGDELSRKISERLAAADAVHDAAQAAIDNPDKVARIEFAFEEEVDGSVPPTIIADFLGEGNFSFALPPGPPRPPVPNIPQ